MIPIDIIRGLEWNVHFGVVLLVGCCLGQYWLRLVEESKIMAVKHRHSIAQCRHNKDKRKHGQDCTEANVLGCKEQLKSKEFLMNPI